MDEAFNDADLEAFLPLWIEAAAEEARSVALGMLRERGRGAVLVGVARVDAALEALLKAALAPPRGSEILFHTDRPLGSFGAKIALAARLSLIDAAVEQSLHTSRGCCLAGRPKPRSSTRSGAIEKPAAHVLVKDTADQGLVGNALLQGTGTQGA